MKIKEKVHIGFCFLFASQEEPGGLQEEPGGLVWPILGIFPLFWWVVLGF